MNGQHLRALPMEELVPKVGEALAEVGMCKEATGEFAKKAGILLQGSLELVADVISQARDVLDYKVIYEEITRISERCKTLGRLVVLVHRHWHTLGPFGHKKNFHLG